MTDSGTSRHDSVFSLKRARKESFQPRRNASEREEAANRILPVVFFYLSHIRAHLRSKNNWSCCCRREFGV